MSLPSTFTLATLLVAVPTVHAQNSMLAERVIEWTEEWEQQGMKKRL